MSNSQQSNLKLTPAADWHETPDAAAILLGLTPVDVHIATRTPVVGARFHEWSAGEIGERLDAMRDAHIAALFGCDFAEATRQGGGEEYLSLWNALPSVADVLARLFGSPSRFGLASHRVIDCDRGAGVNAAFRDEVAPVMGSFLELLAERGA